MRTIAACRVQSRATLRRLLARYAGTGPGDLDFERSQNGKPALVAGPGRPALRFNVSHSATKMLIAVTADRDLGVDVERIQPDFPWEDVACSLFSPDEITAIRGAAHEPPGADFLPLLGAQRGVPEGARHGPVRITSRLCRTRGPAGGAVHDDFRAPSGAAGWHVHPLDVGPGYAATLAVAGDARVICRPLSDGVL